jgi:hypothetical protein
MKERSGNVHENKGPVFHSPVESGNIVENKDSYAFKAGMLLKTQHVSRAVHIPRHLILRGGMGHCASGDRVRRAGA